MPISPKRHYWDSNVFIKLISNINTAEAIEDRRNCELFLQEAIRREIQIFTSTMTIAEVLNTEETPSDSIPHEVRQKIVTLFEEPYITPVMVDLVVATEARELRWRYPWLTTVDSIQVASAIYSKVDVLHTYDGRSRKRRGLLELNQQVGNPPLEIIIPVYRGQLELNQ